MKKKSQPAVKPQVVKILKRKVVAVKAPIAKQKALAPDKKTALHDKIQALQEQMAALDQEAVNELKSKLSDARKVISQLEHELAALTGKSIGSPKGRRERRPSITDEALMPQVHAAMSKFGGEGMNAKQLAERLNQDALRVRKFISSNPKVLKRQGKGPGTRFFLP